jgi:hypothetical protein
MAMPAPTSPNYLIPSITAAGGVVAAVITGFLAAGLKHRWDVRDTALRWERERDERRRDELKMAFGDYLSARAEIEDMRREQVDEGRLAPAINNSTRRYNQLWTLLLKDPLGSHELIASHVAFIAYCHALHEYFQGNGERPVHGSDDDVRRLAHRSLDPVLEDPH